MQNLRTDYADMSHEKSLITLGRQYIKFVFLWLTDLRTALETMEKAPWPMTFWELGTMSTMFGLYHSLFGLRIWYICDHGRSEGSRGWTESLLNITEENYLLAVTYSTLWIAGRVAFSESARKLFHHDYNTIYNFKEKACKFVRMNLREVFALLLFLSRVRELYWWFCCYFFSSTSSLTSFSRRSTTPTSPPSPSSPSSPPRSKTLNRSQEKQSTSIVRFGSAYMNSVLYTFCPLFATSLGVCEF